MEQFNSGLTPFEVEEEKNARASPAEFRVQRPDLRFLAGD